MSDFFNDGPMIRFHCSGCTQLLEIPAENIGQKFRCPACSKESTVPEKSVESPSEENLYGVEHIPSDTRDILKGQKYISFPCSTCYTIISVLPTQVGERIICPECETGNYVPDLPKKEEISSSAGKTKTNRNVDIYGIETGSTFGLTAEQKEEFPVHCPMCGTLLYATENQIGQNLTCPDCEHDVPVREEHKPQKKKTFQSKFYEGGTDFNILEGEKLPPNAKLIPVVCTLCHTLMYATDDQAGEEKECPDCGRMNLIKPIPVENLLTAADLFPHHGEYVVSDGLVLQRPTQRFNVDYRTIEGSLHQRKPLPTDPDDFDVHPEDIKKDHPGKQKKKQKKHDAEEDVNIEAFDETGRVKGNIHWIRPDLPARPLTAKFWRIFSDSPLFMRMSIGIILFCLAAPLISMVIADWTLNIRAGGGVGEAGSAIGFILGFTLGGIVLLLGSMYMVNVAMAVFNTTSNGGDEVDEWGEFSLANIIYSFYYFFMALLVGLLPEIAWRIYASKTIGTEVPNYVTLLSGLAAFLLFPIVMMFMMESVSSVNFFGSGTFRSLFVVPLAWLRFYLLSLPIVVVPGFLVGKLIFSDAFGGKHTSICFALASIVPILTIAYFRLLGRLGWIVEDTFRKIEEEKEEEDGDNENPDDKM